METPGDRIKTRRLELGWTQEVLAQKAGLSKSFLSELENGKRSVSASNLLDLAGVLGVSLDYLMTGQGARAPATNPEAEVRIPAGLSKLATEEGLTYRQTLMLLAMQKQIIAHRARGRKEDLETVDWRRFYESLKEYL